MRASSSSSPAREGRVVGRISAHIDELALAQPPEQGMGPGTGNWGLFEAEGEEIAHALIARAEEWLREQGMTRVLAPISMSIWEEPGLLVKGHDHPPTVMMGHHNPAYQGWVERAGYSEAKKLLTFELDITREFPPLIQRIVAAGEKNPRITIRSMEIKHFDREAGIIIDILNDAWSDNWGFVPFTEAEAEYGGKKMKPLIREDLNMVAELDGEPVAFMLTWGNANEPIKQIGGKLFPFGWIKMLRWLRNPQCETMRVPLMGVKKEYQNSRLASQLAFMMIEYIRRNAVKNYGATRGRNRLDPRRQQGDARDCRDDRQQGQQGIRDLPEGIVTQREPGGAERRFPSAKARTVPALHEVAGKWVRRSTKPSANGPGRRSIACSSSRTTLFLPWPSRTRCCAQGLAREVVICPSTAKAMSELEKARPDAIVIDVHLSDRDDGWALAELVELLGEKRPRIIFSTGSPEDIPPNIAEMGLVFDKPYDPDELARVLASDRKEGLFARLRRKA